ncbi:hypothetical protein BST27_18420 [Mycobacterium intermedium]|uniref:DUF2029 domain-containing protein n=1 Tax=Mycobacterium intermedium TaxID=28445 RepID=A0A1E3S9S7_MYCIE|nr:glycosyltransferase family 87 protein [Mycobacterium intermedium]ODQ98889.1 hypothetical protein BHQ20_19880 [Mycobacterium intermedium]OPE49531.1 hypothetical protein BV508_13760 [Mycobacterium intermedium]ORB00478.1 hypothetical protein BST27_18420 [Mycobacterium intermedium]
MVKGWFAAVIGQSERSLLIGGVLLASTISAVTGYVLTQYYSVDVLSSLISEPHDCMADWGTKVGRHCFSDYALPISVGMRPNPWDLYPLYYPPDFRPVFNNYTAAGMLPQMVFGILGSWLGAPRVGLLGYQLLLTISVLSPAMWAMRSARGLERAMVFVACGFAAIPAWMTIDRGNSVGFVVPIALVFLVALCWRRWGLVAVMVVLAALVKPQFAVIGVVLLAARQWRMGAITLAGGVVTNLAAYALWPRDFPHTIPQSIHNILGYGTFRGSVSSGNVSFAKGLFMIPDGIKARQTGGSIPDGFLAGPRSLIGYIVLVLVVVSILALGRRIPPVMAGIVLLATASLFLAVSYAYYLVFVLPVAALVVRDPAGPPGMGIFDRPEIVGGRRRVVGICVTLAAVVSIAPIALPGPPTHVQIMGPTGAVWGVVALAVTTVFLAPLFWLVTCAAIVASYARRPVLSSSSGHEDAGKEHGDTVVRVPSTPQFEMEFSPKRPE